MNANCLLGLIGTIARKNAIENERVHSVQKILPLHWIARRDRPLPLRTGCVDHSEVNLQRHFSFSIGGNNDDD